MKPLQIRDAQRADIPAIVDFQLAMAQETEGKALDLPTCTRGVSAVFSEATRGRYFVAEADGSIVASVLITYEWSDWRNGTFWWLQSVFVRPEARGQGVFRQLYECVRDLALADAAVCGIRLYVDRRNSRAQETYRRLGMDGDHYQVFEWIK